MQKLKTDSDLTENQIAEIYTVRTTPYLDQMMDVPEIARQYQLDLQEGITSEDEDQDPIGDRRHSPIKGIVHRYPDRVLLKPHHACAVYCRFCFRRDMVGRQGEVLSDNELMHALGYIQNHKEIWEVILTGGDPLALSVRRLQKIITMLDAMEHVKMIRIHTRVPVAAPDLITQDMCDVLKASQTPISLSVHCNHVAELQSATCQALKALHEAGVVLLSQSVLLKNVNDNVIALESLFRALVENHVRPYYLHHPDKARGTGHFRVSIAEGLHLYRQLRGRLSGQCIPHYMLDIPGGYGKVPVQSDHVQAQDIAGEYLLIDLKGRSHFYKD